MEGLICRFRNFVIKRAKAVTSIGVQGMGNFRPKNCANLKVFSILSHVGTDPGESKCRNRDFVRRNFSHSCKGGQTSTKGDRPPGRRKCLKQYVIEVCPRPSLSEKAFCNKLYYFFVELCYNINSHSLNDDILYRRFTW